MKVVLLENVKALGKKLDIVEVSEGYARNYLLPRKLAKLADNKALSEAKSQKSAIDFKHQTQKEEACKIKQLIEQNLLEFKLKAKNGKFFGSVTSKEISDNIKTKLSLDIDKKKIDLEIPIKTAGMYTAKIKLYEGVIANAKVKVEEE